MDQAEIDEILRKHDLWLRGAAGGERANLHAADLSSADLSSADLRAANLRAANLHAADLSSADLSSANLRAADLRAADLRGADLRGADLGNVAHDQHTAFFAMQCPEEGSFVAFKKLRDGCIAKLLIPDDAKRSSATSRKCRASLAIVLEITGKRGNRVTSGRSQHDGSLYVVGAPYHPSGWCEDRWQECAEGVHFFLTRAEAEEY